jgi:undecaprenyl-phosphate galactose phosphotransferase
VSEVAVKEIEDTIEIDVVEENEEIKDSENEVEYKAKFKIYFIFKRLFDIVASLLALIIFSPIFLIVTILIKKEDKGPAFFKQPRIGKNGKVINVYKFRSMVMNAEKVLEELMASDENIRNEYLTNKKLDNDPRITKIGKFIRKTSIDELPQLINVLKGDMSLIGPRPYLLREKDEGMGEYYKYIVSCKPGITGYWQVNGRSDTTFEERCQMEKYYSQHVNAWLDIKILFKTVGVVLFGKGAK